MMTPLGPRGVADIWKHDRDTLDIAYPSRGTCSRVTHGANQAPCRTSEMHMQVDAHFWVPLLLLI